MAVHDLSFLFFWGNPVVQIKIGGQPFRVLLDTGGWTRWIPSSKSTSAEFANRTKYTGQPETSFSMNQVFETSNAGGKYKGNVMMDQLWVSQWNRYTFTLKKIAGRTIPLFTFVEVVEMSGAGDHRKEYDGIIGMRRPPKIAESCEFLKTTFLDCIVNARLVNDAVFTFRFCGQPGVHGDSWFVRGNLNFGDTREDYYHAPFVNLPLYQATQWLVDITSIHYGDVMLCNPCRAHIDTGSPDTFAPAGASSVLLQHSVVESLDDGMLHVCPHKLLLVQPLKIKLHSRVFTLSPEELTREVSNYFGVDACVDCCYLTNVFSCLCFFWFRMLDITISQYKRMQMAVIQRGPLGYHFCGTFICYLTNKVIRWDLPQ
ncbi:saccharopepsin [Clonorchis sinensis]|uniref:Saccharopepsin n=1 Tax=Clonorchis sinensis TaxID=79923 RepID=A0A3R7JW02_CLOSI|nr:saccharopepsin [Clonorchis sinensis]